MIPNKVKHLLAKSAALSTLLFLAFMPSAKAGLDSFEIYLNNRLLVRQAVNQPLSLEALRLNKSNANDKLVIRYFQCNAPGKIARNRMLVIQDAGGAENKGLKIHRWQQRGHGDRSERPAAAGEKECRHSAQPGVYC